MFRRSFQPHNDTASAVNFHLTMAESGRERQTEAGILGSQQMSVTVQNVTSLSLSICQAAVPSASLFVCLTQSLSDSLRDMKQGGTGDKEWFKIPGSLFCHSYRNNCLLPLHRFQSETLNLNVFFCWLLVFPKIPQTS